MTEHPADPTHDSFRELISARLDAALEMGADWDLSVHLLGCARCRQFEHDLGEQRRLLRALPSLVPPRDLWARTSAALDRELLREAQHDRTPRPSPRPAPGRQGRWSALTTPSSLPSVLMVSMASLGLAVVLLITQLGPSIRLPTDDSFGLSTPFGQPGVAVAFVGADAGALTLYRTRVDQSCRAATGCDQGDAVAARVRFPPSFEPNNLALTPRGDRLAIMGIDSERENVFAVMVVPPLEPFTPDGDAPSPARTPVQLTATARPPVGTPAIAVPSLIVVGRTPSPSTGLGGPGSAPVIPGDLTVSTILEDVHGVGAAPAWSADGQALAFSAMPSDRSQGPDIYVWQVGDERARPITSDHGSYFASWSGGVIVVSRVAHAEGETAASAPVVQTVAIDLATLQGRIVDGPDVWLPQVDPTSRRAVAWRGRLAWDGERVVPTHGALYLLDWAAVDPFGSNAPPATPDTGDRGNSSDVGDIALSGRDAAARGTTPPATQSPADTDDQSEAEPSARPTPGRHVRPEPPIATDMPTPRPLDARLVAIEPDRDWLRHPVTDWRAAWSADGRLLGQWIGDVPASVWGHLSVLSIDIQGRLDHEQPILESTLARRGFNLESNRIAWVAPLVGARSGELRVRLWDGDGVRDVHMQPAESAGVVAAF